MTEIAHPTAPADVDEPEPAPEEPTGADDPFDPVDPEDPYSLTDPQDPLAPEDPDPDPTTTRGVELPPPEPPPSRQPPPGQAVLASAVTNLGTLPDPKDPTASTRIRCWRVAQEGRFSLSDHWAALKGLQLATADVATRGAADRMAEQTKLNQLRQDLAGDGGVSAALEAWCAARDATPVDLTELADAAGKLKDAVDPLRKLLDVNSNEPTDADYHRMLLGQALDGIVTEVANEGKQALAGERVARGTPSDVPTYHLERMTRDLNWSERLMASKTWADAGSMVTTAIDTKRGRFLDIPVSKASGKLNLQPVTDALAGLDAAVRARDSATPPVDYTTRSEVLRRYLAAADKLQQSLKTLQNRQVELAGNPKSPGWDIAQTRSAGDALAGMARTLYNSLATDPLVQDPDLAGSTRTGLGQIDVLAQQTSLEGLVDKLAAGLRNDKTGAVLRKAWSDAKNSELKALKATGADLGDLPKQFDSGLGPLLQEWSTEIAKFPAHDRATVKDLATQISEQLQQYRTAIKAQLGDKFSSRLVLGLDVVAAAVVGQIRSYDSRGGLFS
jgi:hypothetical protein